eukprot:CAMPEP_0182485564 /NCGR_PEP_ID=MMETSP1319-20130603/45491_1 /TAXON_ID=172717 /ORGANISM="Bolidomonas pacifica, Strain RCC208" /LENGTH=513 /DNA_ID=CAMNT_0024687555 /DNA_START=69 /DNA_END=1607 /DNA_ORIENTATION=+
MTGRLGTRRGNARADSLLVSSDSSDDESGVYVNKDIEARYAKLRKEAKVMKKQAEAELRRLKKVVDDIQLGPGKKCYDKDEAPQRNHDNQVKARRRAEKRAKAKAEAYEKERKERIFVTVQAAQAAQREAQEEETKTRTQHKSSEPKRPPRRRPPSQPEAQRPSSKSSAEKAAESAPWEPSSRAKPPTFTRKASRFNTKERPSRYVGRMPAASPPKRERRQTSFSDRRPSWDNSKGPRRQKKSKEKPSWAGEFFDNIKDLDSEDFDMSDIHENLRRHAKSRRSRFRPEKAVDEDDVSADDDNDDDFGKSEKPEVEERKRQPKDTPLRFQTAQEKGERARKGRLAANRAALGLDGGAPPPGRQENSRGGNTSEKREEEKRGQPKRASGSGVHYSDPLEAELNKFRERAKREQKSRRLDDVAVRTYESMWSGFEALASKVQAGSIRFDNIPWLPVLVLMGPGGKESWRVIGVDEHASFEDKKAALRAQTMRWHPDKFLSRFGSALFPEDYTRIES